MRSRQEAGNSFLFSKGDLVIGGTELSVKKQGRESVSVVSFNTLQQTKREGGPNASSILIFLEWFIPEFDMSRRANLDPKVGAMQSNLGFFKNRESGPYFQTYIGQGLIPKRDDDALGEIKRKTSGKLKQMKTGENRGKSFTVILENHSDIVSVSPNVNRGVDVQDVSNEGVDTDSKKQRGKGASLSNTGVDIESGEERPSYTDGTNIVRVENGKVIKDGVGDSNTFSEDK